MPDVQPFDDWTDLALDVHADIAEAWRVVNEDAEAGNERVRVAGAQLKTKALELAAAEPVAGRADPAELHERTERTLRALQLVAVDMVDQPTVVGAAKLLAELAQAVIDAEELHSWNLALARDVVREIGPGYGHSDGCTMRVLAQARYVLSRAGDASERAAIKGGDDG